MEDRYTLTPQEKASARRHKVALKDLGEYGMDELAGILDVPAPRAREVFALYDFQRVPSIGVRFAEDLISIGYYSLAEVAGATGPKLVHELELHSGYPHDPCVEDQCRLVVHFAKHEDTSMRWWHFTAERKAYREKHGYPKDRPVKGG